MPWQSLHSQHKPEEKRAEGEDERRKELEQMEFEMLSGVSFQLVSFLKNEQHICQLFRIFCLY